MSSVNLQTVQDYQDAIVDFVPDLIHKGFFGFETINHVTVAEGNKGVRVITELQLGDIVYAWTKNHVPREGVIDYRPREIRVRAQKADLQIVPQEYEASYLGAQRKRGQNPAEDIPQQAYHLMKIMEKIGQTNEIGIWQGVLDETVALDNRKLVQNLDGYLKILANEVTEGNLSPVALQGGVWTTDNVIPTLEAMYKRLDPAAKRGVIKTYCPFHVVELYKSAYREKYGKYVGEVKGDNGIQLDFGDVTLVKIPGMGTTNRVLMTAEENVLLDFDAFSDTNTIRLQPDIRSMNLYVDYKMGVEFALVDDGIMSVA